ncbi:hypothetical protein AB6H27_13915 [Providencia huaxiensis]|uniref:hypothetical protein n=1 Tax=Providencia TaxID=586 RepID=UPI001CFE5BC9|nr:hypothetical protein [Providencia rettgeri]EIU7558078.1 hypothetical protein [Providencia rettgeri]MCB4843100.1 hypothetical protein [Providencia rettgeri]MCG5276328.1 hypothetical protein [Providencia rettgeri]MCG9507186.1 hypothetical protein [Providencia rettgeri]
MITFEVLFWIASFFVISAVAFIAWVVIMILRSNARLDAQREKIKNKVANGD